MTAARYQPGAWERAGDALRVQHGDQIGTSRFMTNAAAQTARRAVFTAFGELVMADDGHGQPAAASRYGYAGAWGYETGLDDGGEPDLPPQPFIHVGERWYDPSSGRFLQRDPIGIEGGLNVFAYVANNPSVAVDPFGRDRWIVNEAGHQGVIYGDGHIGYWRLDYKMRVPRGSPWWHWPKDIVESVFRGACALVLAAPGHIEKQPTNKPNRPPDRVTTNQEDTQLHDKYHEGEYGWYDLFFNNCRHQAERWLNE